MAGRVNCLKSGFVTHSAAHIPSCWPPEMSTPFRTLHEPALKDSSTFISYFCAFTFLPHWLEDQYPIYWSFSISDPAQALWSFFSFLSNIICRRSYWVYNTQLLPILEIIPWSPSYNKSFLTKFYISIITPFKFNFYLFFCKQLKLFLFLLQTPRRQTLLCRSL